MNVRRAGRDDGSPNWHGSASAICPVMPDLETSRQTGSGFGQGGKINSHSRCKRNATRDSAHEEPASADAKRASCDAKPFSTDAKPVTANEKRVSTDERPVTGAAEPVSTDAEGVGVDEKPHTANSEHVKPWCNAMHQAACGAKRVAATPRRRKCPRRPRRAKAQAAERPAANERYLLNPSAPSAAITAEANPHFPMDSSTRAQTSERPTLIAMIKAGRRFRIWPWKKSRLRLEMGYLAPDEPRQRVLQHRPLFQGHRGVEAGMEFVPEHHRTDREACRRPGRWRTRPDILPARTRPRTRGVAQERWGAQFRRFCD